MRGRWKPGDNSTHEEVKMYGNETKDANPMRDRVLGGISQGGAFATEGLAPSSRGPRVTMQDIEANIACEYSVNAGEVLAGNGGMLPRGASSLNLLTVHFIVLKNGFVVIGKAAPVSAENFNPHYGKQLAREDAIRQVWPLMGYALRGRMPREY
jgi:hypothetical protein